MVIAAIVLSLSLHWNPTAVESVSEILEPSVLALLLSGQREYKTSPGSEALGKFAVFWTWSSTCGQLRKPFPAQLIFCWRLDSYRQIGLCCPFFSPSMPQVSFAGTRLSREDVYEYCFLGRACKKTLVGVSKTCWNRRNFAEHGLKVDIQNLGPAVVLYRSVLGKVVPISACFYCGILQLLLSRLKLIVIILII